VTHHSGFGFLAAWYREQCDGDWEHEFGIRIATLDNPGWDVEVDLTGTDLEGRVVARQRTEPAGGRWMFVASTGQMFQASCDPSSLDLVLAAFQRFTEPDRPAPGVAGRS
jgi:hypothetical protein